MHKWYHSNAIFIPRYVLLEHLIILSVARWLDHRWKDKLFQPLVLVSVISVGGRLNKKHPEPHPSYPSSWLDINILIPDPDIKKHTTNRKIIFVPNQKLSQTLSPANVGGPWDIITWTKYLLSPLDLVWCKKRTVCITDIICNDTYISVWDRKIYKCKHKSSSCSNFSGPPIF